MNFVPRRISRSFGSSGSFVSLALPLLALGTFIAACSGASTDDHAPGTATEAQVCESGGIHVESCGNGITHPVLQKCAVNLVCTAAYKATPGYDPAYIKLDKTVLGNDWTLGTDLTAQLVAAGCGPQRYYTTPSSPGATWATAICSQPVVVPDALNVGVIPCDTCTGRPDVSSVVVAWLVEPGYESGCRVCGPPVGTPNPGCNELNCIGTGME